MKKSSLFSKIKVFTFIFSTLIFQACRENVESVSKISPNSITNFLVFDTREEYHSAIQKLSRASYADLHAYEKQNNFVSMRTMLKEAEYEDAKNHEQEIAQSEGIRKTAHKTPNIIKENPTTFLYSPDEGIQLNLTNLDLASILNKDGIVKVAGKIIQYSKWDVKIIEDGNPDKIALLNKITQTNKELGITVNPINFRSNSNKNAKLAYSYTRSCEGATGSPAQYKIIVYEEAYDFDDGVLRYWVGTYTIRTLKRGFLGYWYNHATRSQYGSVNVSYTSNPSPLAIIYSYGWAQTPIILSPGSYSFNNSSGDETSTWVITFFRYNVNVTAGYNYPYNEILIKFSDSTTSNFVFGTGGANCNCSI